MPRVTGTSKLRKSLPQMKRTTFSSTNATPIEAIASENGRRSRIGWNAIRSTISATVPVATSAPSHASAMGARTPWFSTSAT